MPPRLTENPYLAQLPDFRADSLRAVYATLATNDRPVETIIAELEDAWVQNNNTRKAAWDTQVEEDREAEAENDWNKKQERERRRDRS